MLNIQLQLIVGLQIPSIVLPFLINLLLVSMLIRGIYFKIYKKSELFLTYFGFNTIIFFVAYVLNKVEMSTGAAFGLFAVFSILRYRTEGISAKDMTYLFLSIALGLLGATVGDSAQQIGIGIAILSLVYTLESGLIFAKEHSKEIIYDNIALTHTAQNDALINDLKERTGLNIVRCDIQEMDYLKDACKIIIYYVD